MTARLWTAAEVCRCIAERQAGMSLDDIAEAHGRTKSAIQMQLWRHRVVTRTRSPARVATLHERQLAREALAWELAEARAERATAPLYRRWPAGTWS